MLTSLIVARPWRRARFVTPLVAVALVLAGVAACDDKKDTTPTPVPSVLATSSTPVVASSAAASATVTASAEASAAPSASAMPPDASASAVASAGKKPGDGGASPAASAGSNASGAGVCGKKPLPDCPLQGWMKGNTSAAMATQDFAALAKALDATVALGPAGYGNWASISRDGAKAARDQSIDGVKASCRGCHNQYQTRYRNELRTRKI
jgi:hypothetical protein